MYKPSEDKFVVRALLDGEIFFLFLCFFKIKLLFSEISM
jgi:hypothetical protein